VIYDTVSTAVPELVDFTSSGDVAQVFHERLPRTVHDPNVTTQLEDDAYARSTHPLPAPQSGGEVCITHAPTYGPVLRA
jgi:hypothetical protein